MSTVISCFKKLIWLKTWPAQYKSHIWKILEERTQTRSYLLERSPNYTIFIKYAILLFSILYITVCDIFMQNEMGKKKRKISTALLMSHRHKKITK